LREHFGIAANNAHRALDDVIVLHKVFSNMTGDLSIQQVYALLNEPRALTSMPFGKHQGQPLSKIPRDYVSWLHKTGAFEKAENQALYLAFQELGLTTAST
jgi:DNA polymerase-3 subunit epsilon